MDLRQLRKSNDFRRPASILADGFGRTGRTRFLQWTHELFVVYSRHSQIRGVRVEKFPTLRKPWAFLFLPCRNPRNGRKINPPTIQRHHKETMLPEPESDLADSDDKQPPLKGGQHALQGNSPIP
jgi:hypothetical protein